MPKALPPKEFLEMDTPILDVRSPAEFDRGHIPGAFSLPLFSNEERALVGTIYKQQGRDAAVLEGLRLVGPSMASIVEKARALAPGGAVRVHCWRGGERSGSVAWLLEKAGLREVFVLQRGYKAYREHVNRRFEQSVHLRVLGGFTGTGKTGILRALREHGEQVIDLEALACHKGSAFGALGEAPQPTTEHFENLLWHALERLDPYRPVWVEDESLMIGHIRLPLPFHRHMRQAPLLFLDMPVGERAQRLVHDYGSYSREELAAAISRISKRMGPQHHKAALVALEAGDLLQVARLALVYYDKAYLRGMQDRDPQRIEKIPFTTEQLPQLLDRMTTNAERIH